jgi:hypothetical protein
MAALAGQFRSLRSKRICAGKQEWKTAHENSRAQLGFKQPEGLPI